MRMQLLNQNGVAACLLDGLRLCGQAFVSLLVLKTVITVSLVIAWL